MNFFKKAIVYNDLAKAFNGFYIAIQKLRDESEYKDVRDELFGLAYVARLEIIDRMEAINYKMSTRIAIPMMPGNNKTLEYAYFQTIGKLVKIGADLGYSEEIQEILNKGNFFFEIENSIPLHLRPVINL
jgi:hypothetical protein